MTKVMVFLILFVGIIYTVVKVQIYLSKRENRWMGLIIPIIQFMLSIIVVFGLMSFSYNNSMEKISTMDENGNIVHEEEIFNENKKGDTRNSVFMSIPIFLIYNIPTIILFIIYYDCRSKIKRNKEIETMNLRDL